MAEDGRVVTDFGDLSRRVGQKLRDDQDRKKKDFEDREEAFKLAGYTWRRWPVHGEPRHIENRNHKSCGLVVSDPSVHDPLCPANGRGRKELMLDGSPPL